MCNQFNTAAGIVGRSDTKIIIIAYFTNKTSSSVLIAKIFNYLLIESEEILLLVVCEQYRRFE